MDIFFGVIVGLIVLMLLVTAHEFGHFVMARRNGVRVPEFGIGFPPRAVAWIKDPRTHKWRRLKKSEWDKSGIMKTVLDEGKGKSSVKDDGKLFADGMVFSLNFLPIGGFCQMDGESAEDTREGTFGKASFWKKTKILFGGVAMNWIVAFVVFTILAWTGMPIFLENQFTVGADTRTTEAETIVKEVYADSPAEAAGMAVGDVIVEIDGNKIASNSDVVNYNNEHAGEEVVYKIYRRGEPDCNCDENLDLKVKLNTEDNKPLLGISMERTQARSYSTWSAPIVGAGLTLQITGETFKGVGELLWNLITGTGRLFSFDDATRESGQEALSEVRDSVSGPVGIVGMLFPMFTTMGPSNLAFLAALISVSLACMNVLPIPALDGGRWLLIAIYKLRHKKLTKETEQRIVSRAMFVLLALIAIVTVLDILRIARVIQ